MILVPFHHLHLHALFFGEFLFLVIVDSIADMLNVVGVVVVVVGFSITVCTYS